MFIKVYLSSVFKEKKSEEREWVSNSECEVFSSSPYLKATEDWLARDDLVWTWKSTTLTLNRS